MGTRNIPEQIGDLLVINRPANSARLLEGITVLRQFDECCQERLPTQ